jgi:hypothetical protein
MLHVLINGRLVTAPDLGMIGSATCIAGADLIHLDA